MAKQIDEKELNKILEIDADNFSEFCKKVFSLFPDGLDMSRLTNAEKQRFRVKELSYSVCGDIKYNKTDLICNRCNSKKVAQFIYGDVFMRMCNGNKKQEMEKFRRMGLFINPSPTRVENAMDYICLECGNEW